MNSSIARFALLIGIANPSPILPPDWLAIQVLMPDHLAGQIDERTAGVTLVDRRVGLDIVGQPEICFPPRACDRPR